MPEFQDALDALDGGSRVGVLVPSANPVTLYHIRIRLSR